MIFLFQGKTNPYREQDHQDIVMHKQIVMPMAMADWRVGSRSFSFEVHFYKGSFLIKILRGHPEISDYEVPQNEFGLKRKLKFLQTVCWFMVSI